MATVKVILKSEKKKKDGKIPLYIRIIKNRKATFIALGISVKASDWNEEAKKVRKSHPNSGRLNAFISQKIAEAEGKAVELETEKSPVSRFKIKKEILSQEPVDFFKFADDYQESLERAGKIGVSKKVKSVINKLKDYCTNPQLYMSDMNLEFLLKYQDYLISKKSNRTNTLTSNFKVIRRILNDAINQGKMNRADNPFYTFKMKNEPSRREYLTEAELTSIEELDLSDQPRLTLIRDMYVFAAYSGGIRISDLLLLRWNNFDGERLHLKMKKTNREHHIKLPGTAVKILESYKNPVSNPSDLIFPLINTDLDFKNPKALYNAISSANAQGNERLKDIASLAEIEKTLSFHTARHTFATQALRKGIRIEYVSKLLGHSNIKETQVYAKIIDEELDKAMDVFNK